MIHGVCSRFPFLAARSLAGRYHSELDSANVQSCFLRSVFWNLDGRFSKRNLYDNYVAIGNRFGCAVRDLLCREALPDGSLFFGYDTGSLETLEYLKEKGIFTVVGQMDPNRVEAFTVAEEEKRWPGWTMSPMAIPDAFFKRREAEWRLADRVLVNSEFCRDGLLKQGVPASKLIVVPLSYEVVSGKGRTLSDGESVFCQARPLRVLWLGQVVLRKGIQYLLEAAKLLESEPVVFDIVGPIGITQAAVKSASQNVIFHGKASRDSIGEWYCHSDVFVLPTLSDGFALTQLEAMAYGVPVVATPCCGAVVTDGRDGFIVPLRDSKALAGALLRYVQEPGILSEQKVGALEKVRHFSMENLASNLLKLELDVISSKKE